MNGQGEEFRVRTGPNYSRNSKKAASLSQMYVQEPEQLLTLHVSLQANLYTCKEDFLLLYTVHILFAVVF